ncbi:MAG TPA: hypothetical protein VM821_07375 [Abditibacteriaceae bacterium]|nr:hypothetical protein [Abditibacteriaceae bacterium]
MTVLRYQYPRWPGESAGAEVVINSGTFDFVLEDAVERLAQAQETLSYNSHIHWPAQKANNLALLALIRRLKQPDLLEHEIVVWEHPTRDWSIQQLEQEQWRWGQALQKWSNANSPAFMASLIAAFNGDVTTTVEQPKEVEMFIPPTAYLPDSLLGQNLSWLLYERRFLSVLCPACEATYAPEKCVIERWKFSRSEGEECEGEKIVCPKGHTLHGACTMMTEW